MKIGFFEKLILNHKYGKFSFFLFFIKIFLLLNVALSLVIIIDLFTEGRSEKAVVTDIRKKSFIVHYADSDWSELSLKPNFKEKIDYGDSIFVNFTLIFKSRTSYYLPDFNEKVNDLAYGFPLFIIILNVVVFLVLLVKPKLHDDVMEEWHNVALLDYIAYGYLYTDYLLFVFIVPILANIYFWIKLVKFLIALI